MASNQAKIQTNTIPGAVITTDKDSQHDDKTKNNEPSIDKLRPTPSLAYDTNTHN